MRLTLRTLLAYLDNTLDAQDAEALRAKLDESGFATQLVQRIRASLAYRDLAAPSPEAVGPVEEANVISEYLDSTLPSEQVAEIERACLESDMHLAEAAACHQVLTMVLGKSAQVTPELRQRIYDLPQRDLADIAVAGSFSSVAIPDQPALGSLQDVIPTADSVAAPAGKPVVPVGPEDSGVSDAPTRLREAGVVNAGDTSELAASAGSRARALEDSYYGGSMRPSRITSWLVSFALAGVVLFALTRIFKPVIDRYTVDSGGQQVQLDSGASISAGADSREDEIEVPAAEAPAMIPVETPTDNADSGGPASAETSVNADLPAADSLPAPRTETLPNASLNESPAAPAKADSEAGVASATSEEAANRPVSPQADLNAAKDDLPAALPPAVPPSAVSADSSADSSAAGRSPQEMKNDLESPESLEPPKADAVSEPGNIEVAKVTSAGALMAGHAGDGNWVRLKNEMLVGDGATVFCGPTFRGQMSSATGFKVTAVGATQLEWHRNDDGKITLHLDYGRILITSAKQTSLQVRLGDFAIDLEFPEVETVAAVSLQHLRAPGFDPLIEESRIPLAEVLTVQRVVNLRFDGNLSPLQTGQQWYRRGNDPPQTSVIETAPGWIDDPDPDESSLESMARRDLLNLVDNDQPLDIALREAMTFRKSEVGAVAGQTLLYLGHGDAYFGGDGVLSNPKQRAYWPDHYLALMVNVDRSAESASALNEAIGKMESADSKLIFRLLTGYSQKQLVEGGDEELVGMLDSSSMAVRVLAIQNLHKITGTTLYFRADEENAIRRAPDIKKWEVRQRKGDIRWQE